MSHVTMNVDEKKAEEYEEVISEIASPLETHMYHEALSSESEDDLQEQEEVAGAREVESPSDSVVDVGTQVEMQRTSKDEKGSMEKEKIASDAKGVNCKQLYDAFVAELEHLNNADEKLKRIIDFMGSALATKHGVPYFKGFWDARTLALQLFKENISPILRGDLWNQYVEYSKEARRLKDMLDEQSAFASEQIEIAIKSIENEQENLSTALSTIPRSDFLKESQTLSKNEDFYSETQAKLQLLSAHASRITALRKELIHIEMRVRQKNKFFQRLSVAGDRTFPPRKELIKELSQHFNRDVDDFVERYFTEQQELRESIFFLREEIKALQAVAKHLTLNTQSFTYTRMRLSECWEKLKVFDKERKKQRAESKILYKENADALQKKFEECREKIESGEWNRENSYNRLDQLQSEMRETELSREEIKHLRDQIIGLRNSLLEKEKLEEQERIRHSQERDRLKKFRIQELKNEIEALLMELESYDAERLTTKKDEFSQKIVELAASKLEKQELERLLKPVKDAIVDKKENAVLALSDDDRQALEQLREVLQQRKERRQEIKKQLEILRKSRGASGLDFEQALNFNAQLDAEKERLEKISEGITEIEGKIAALQAKG